MDGVSFNICYLINLSNHFFYFRFCNDLNHRNVAAFLPHSHLGTSAILAGKFRSREGKLKVFS